MRNSGWWKANLDCYEGLYEVTSSGVGMPHPQDYFLIVYALAGVALEHKGSDTETRALSIASKIAEQHGLTAQEAILQLDLGCNYF